jgi:HPt (histidine-containing phosphotransfer) domain-containing protein
MKFIESCNDAAATAVLADDTFEQLQVAFYARLRKDRVRLVVIGTTLARSGSDPAPAFEELRNFAHRLRGASAIFGAVEIRDAAQALEEAAHIAQTEHADEGDGQVWSSLALLSDLLASVTESVTSPSLTPVPRHGPSWRP